MKVFLVLTGLMFISACSNNLYYNPKYIKDGKYGGYADDLNKCEERARIVYPDDPNATDYCMQQKGWIPTSKVELSL